MRMWMVDPKLMCRKHLMGEHVEIHMFVGSILKGISMKGYVEKGLIEPSAFQTRHDDLVAEMLGRGYRHASDLPEVDLTNRSFADAQVDREAAHAELCRRCPECRRLADG